MRPTQAVRTPGDHAYVKRLEEANLQTQTLDWPLSGAGQ